MMRPNETLGAVPRSMPIDASDTDVARNALASLAWLYLRNGRLDTSAARRFDAEYVQRCADVRDKAFARLCYMGPL